MSDSYFVYGKTGKPDPKYPDEPYIETWWLVKEWIENE